MRRIFALAVALGMVMGFALPAVAEGAEVHLSHDDVWGFTFQHYNPCTATLAVVEWEAEHRSMLVDRDGDETTDNDQLKNPKVKEVLWATHSQPGWEVVDVGDSLSQIGWDEAIRFSDEDQASVVYRVWLRADNPDTGQSYQVREVLHWVSNGQGQVVLGVGNTITRSTTCIQGPSG